MTDDFDIPQPIVSQQWPNLVSPAVFASQIRTLHYLTVPLYDANLGNLNGCECWRIIRSNTSGDETRFKKLSRHDGEEVQKRLWAMDRKSLLEFDIDAFLQAY